MVNFLLRSLAVTLEILLFWIYFSFDASICSAVAFLTLRNSDHVIASVFIDFPLTSCYLKFLDKLQKQICRTFGLSLTSLISFLAQLIEFFPLTYDLSGFKTIIRFFLNRFPTGFNLFVLLFLVTLCLTVASFCFVRRESQLKKIILKKTALFIGELTTILMLIWTVFVVIWEMLHRRISLNLVLLLLVLILWVGPSWNQCIYPSS